jgi:hypothetical protein
VHRRLVIVVMMVMFGSACADKHQDSGVSSSPDLDGDGHSSLVDCDDEDAAVHPGATEICNGLDDDCDGYVDDQDPGLEGGTPWYLDDDGDGYGLDDQSVTACEPPSGYASQPGDCHDGAPAVHPGADEICNGLDDDCDAAVDEDPVDGGRWYADTDGDGYGSGAGVLACAQPSGGVSLGGDCDEADAAINPGADELCDGADNDCDGVVDEDDAVDASSWYADADGDGYGDASGGATACSEPGGYVADSTDCDDAAALVNPGADELCDGVDNDCDAAVDEDDAVDASSWYADTDGDGYGSGAGVLACAQPSGGVSLGGDCDEADAAINPGADELCDGADNDCDGVVDEDDAVDASSWYADADGDGYGDASGGATACSEPGGYVADSTDCDDAAALVNPGADELCDGVDNDCDAAVDEADAVDASSWYLDTDGDGYGSGPGVLACAQPSGSVSLGGDCDEADVAVNPGATELCNGVDDDCDGSVDGAGAADAGTWYPDLDADGYGDAARPLSGCSQPSGTVLDGSDCDDGDAAINPGATELCNGVDDDCDGGIDAPGLATWVDAGGVASDLSATLGAGSSGAAVPYNVASSGTLYLCAGTWYAHLGVTALDVSVVGPQGSASTVLQGDGSGSVVTVTSPAGALSLEGLTITGGVATYGGGVNGGDRGLSLELDDVVVEGCSAGLFGGGIYQVGGSVIAQDLVLEGNSAGDYGGGLFVYTGAVDILGLEVVDNIAGYAGGGVYLGGLDADIQQASITDNSAPYAAGVYLYSGELALGDSEVADNAAGYYGGGFYVYYSSLSLQSCQVHGNSGDLSGSSGIGGGLFVYYQSTVTCTGSTSEVAGVYGNSATYGGGVFLYDYDSIVISDTCDWGTSTGGDDNWSSDLLGSYLTSASYGANASFTCTGYSCY